MPLPSPRPTLSVPLAALVAGTVALVAPATAQTAGARATAEGRFIRALTAQALDDDATALRLVDEVLAEVPGDPTVLLLRAELAASPADAVYYARQSADAAPGRADVWLGLADALRAAGQPAEAARALAAAERLAPDDLDVLVAAAELAAEQNDAGREREVLGRLVRVGDTVAARLRLSALAEAAGDRDGALAQAQAAARLDPSEPAVRRRLAELAPAPATAASAAMATGRPAGAGSTEAPSPTDTAGPTDGAALFAAGRYADAAEALLAEVDRDPRRIEGWSLALQALARTADPRAGAVADDALLLFSSVPSVVAGAAEAYAAAGRADDARATAQRGLDALARLGDDVPDAGPLRARLDAVLSQ